MTFKDLGLNDKILQAISEKGYTEPSVIQEKAIPEVLKGKDILASAQTGTGKTAGFALPILHRLAESPVQGRKKIRALILTPTRELAAQIQEEIKEYSKHTGLQSTVIFGGVKQNPQVARLRAGIDILIATPGRLLDLHGQKLLRLNEVDIFVLDEADRMLDMGFVRDIKKILELLPTQRQNLLFSATFSTEIEKLANRFLTDPVKVAAAPKNARAESIDQEFFRIDKNQKPAFLIQTIKENNWEQTLIFTRTKHGANKLCKKLIQKGISAAAIHGNKTQNARTKALADFKAGEVQCLVATDIAARGLDIPLLPQVINYELPNIAEDYVHRIGRTGRAGASGFALNLVQADEIPYVRAIEKLVKDRFELKISPDFEPEENEVAEPAKSQSRNNQQNRFKRRR